MGDIIEEILELLFFMILVELHVVHAPPELFKHQSPTHSAVLVEYLFICLHFSDLLDLHDVGRKVDCPNHPDTDSLSGILNVLVKLGEVDSVLRDCVSRPVTIEQLLKLVLRDCLESTLGVH